jgi:hypothetical protein
VRFPLEIQRGVTLGAASSARSNVTKPTLIERAAHSRRAPVDEFHAGAGMW